MRIHLICAFLYGWTFSIQGMGTFSFEGAVLDHSSGIQVIYSTAIGQGTPTYQQDRIACIENETRWSCGVFDGHGGAAVAQQLADEKNGLLPTLMRLPLSRDSIKKEYIEYNKQFAQEQVAGSTAVTFIVDFENKQYFLACCGDSVGILIKKQELVFKTLPHDAKDEIEQFRITNSGGFVRNDRVRAHSINPQPSIEVTRSFGDNFFVGETGNKLIIPDPDVNKGKLEQPLIGVLFSDGFLNYFSRDSKDPNFLNNLKDIICKLIEIGRPIEGLAKDLIGLMRYLSATTEEILEKIQKNTNWDTIKEATDAHWSNDNVSLIVFQINPPARDPHNPVIGKVASVPQDNSKENKPSRRTSSNIFTRMWLKTSRTGKILFVGGLLFGGLLMYFGFMKYKMKKFK